MVSPFWYGVCKIEVKVTNFTLTHGRPGAGERNPAMKTIRFQYILPVLALITSCSSTYYPGSSQVDDVYYSPRNNPAPAVGASAPASAPSPNAYSSEPSNYNPSPSTQSEDLSQDFNYSSGQTDEQGSSTITNNYYNQDDYYDYAYSARIRRFYDPVIGAGFYDPFYTNMYWYDYNPIHWGSSIYLGYNWWAPPAAFYQPFGWNGLSVGIGWNNWGWGGGWNNWGWGGGWNNWGWGGGWNNWGWGGGYWNGFNQGYWNGFYDGLWAGTAGNPYYYNSFDNNSWHYGPRGSASTNSPSGNAPRPMGASIGQKFEQAVSEGRVELPSRGSNNGFGTNPDPTGITPSKQPVNGQSNEFGRPSPKNTETPNPGFDRPSRGIITDKNQQGTRPSKDLTEPARPNQQGGDFGPRPDKQTPSKGENQGRPSNPSNFGTRPSKEQAPSKSPNGTRPNDFSRPYTEPRKQPQQNPGFSPAPAPSQPKRNGINGGQRKNSFSQPSGPRMESRPNEPAPRNVTPRQSEPRKNRQFDFRTNGGTREERGGRQEFGPRQENRAPTFQPRNQPKQFSQPSPGPRSSPSPSQPSNGGGNNRRR